MLGLKHLKKLDNLNKKIIVIFLKFLDYSK